MASLLLDLELVIESLSLCDILAFLLEGVLETFDLTGELSFLIGDRCGRLSDEDLDLDDRQYYL